MTQRALLMIPGPIELEPDVLQALGAKTRSHLDPVFIAIFGRVIAGLREVFRAPSAAPFVVAGSGTLAMELAVANVIEPGDAALVVGTGYFGDRMREILSRYGAKVTRLDAPPGEAPALAAVEEALTQAAFKALAVTHVDTSTAVRAPVEALAALARRHGVLSIVDGVCAVGGEVFEQEAWGVDLAITASQKALGAPPGLAIVMASSRALEAWRRRRAKVASLYLDFGEWLPIHQAYAEGRPAYFATPPVNLITSLDASLTQILSEGMAARWQRHARMAAAFRAGFSALGLKPVPAREALAAHTLSALYYPDREGAGLVARVAREGVTVAGGLHPEIKTKYFRVGHMGAVSESDVLATLGAIARALGPDTEAGVAAAARALTALPVQSEMT